MNFDEFLNTALEAGASVGPYSEFRDGYHYFYTSWISGGICGNNCWDHLKKEVEPESEQTNIQEFDNFMLNLGLEPEVIEDVFKRLSFEENVTDDYDYYYNYNEYTYLAVEIESLYEYLVSANLIQGPTSGLSM